jgi:hypothetical protein
MDNYLDPNVEKDDAKNSYEKLLALLEKDPEKNKGGIIEAYKYLGYYYIMKSEQIDGSDKAQQEQLKNTGKDYWLKILAIDPNDAQAKQVVEELNQTGKKTAKPTGKAKK